MTHKEKILKHLRSGQPLTRREALLQHNVGRLAARVHELRQAGHPIESRMIDVKNANGETCRVAEYYLPQGQTEMPL
jgi:multidrug resistance efflux pump